MSFSSDFSASQDAYVAPGFEDVPSTVFFEAEEEDVPRKCGCSRQAFCIAAAIVVVCLVVTGLVVGITVPLTTGSHHSSESYWRGWSYCCDDSGPGSSESVNDEPVDNNGACRSNADCGSGGHCYTPTYCGGAAPPYDFFEPQCIVNECEFSSDCPGKSACVQGTPNKICVPAQCDFATGNGCPSPVDRCTLYIAAPCTSIPSQVYCAAPNDPCHSDSDCMYGEYCAAGDCEMYFIAA
mmetsp:Transcript_15872/g.62010  ORF Transcript_15872/g.62010 Transcript_15872/m.62010 type:complete len:238 (+) Transcript_15872:1347-2060(+)